MPTRYANAVDCVPKPFRVFGTQLQPFSLGHHLLLQRLAIDPLNAQIEFDDFLICVFTCAATYRDGLKAHLDGTWNDAFARWRKQIEKVARKDRSANRVFFEYITDGYRKPPIWQHVYGLNSITFTAPWELLMKNRLIAAGHTEDDVMNRYLPAVRYDYYTVLELNQASQLLDAKNWKNVFVTEDVAKRMDAANG